MSATIPLPSPLRVRLNAIHRRIRLLRAGRGLASLAIVLSLVAAAALLVDYWLDLPSLARQVILSVWLIVGAACLLRGTIVPLFQRIDAAALAAVIEEKYPDFGERLCSAVELAGAPAEGHGSPLFISLLLEETMARSEPLDFRLAVPARRASVSAILAGAILLLFAMPALVWPRQYGELSQRFLRPWDVPPPEPPYNIVVSPGDAISACGRSLILSAQVAPRWSSRGVREQGEKTVPDTATLLVVQSNGEETRQAMTRGERGDFTVSYKVSENVYYRIEAGEVASDFYRITAIAPVELSADSPSITIIPPAYARSVKEEETYRGLVDLAPLHYSEIRFDFRFTRPAVAAYLEFSRDPQGSESALASDSRPNDFARHSLILSADGQEGSLVIQAINEAKYRLILEAEHDIRTELQGGTIHITPDQPPAVRQFTGPKKVGGILPSERIPLEIKASDDIGVACIELEYRVNEGDVVRQPLDFQGGNTPSAEANHVLELTGKVKHDDRFFYRFRVRDNLPKEHNGPHDIVYPADHWLTLRIARSSDSLNEKEILLQRDELDHRLQEIREALLQEKRAVYRVKQETRDQASLASEKREEFQQLQRDNKASQQALREAAEMADATETLQPVADLARDVADKEMQKGQQALEQAPQRKEPAERTRQLETADEQLDSAIKRLDELKKMNDRLAQELLDRAKLEMLAQREKQLAERATELAANHPVLDKQAREKAEKLKREQAEAAGELERLAQRSEPLKQALQQAWEDEARKLAEQARELAQSQRELAKEEAENARQRKTDRFDDLAREQRELAQEQKELAQQTRPAAPAARTEPLKPEMSQRAADALQKSKPSEAIQQQEQAANDLERLAQAFERAAKASADPKEAARQLRQAEKTLKQRVQEETAKKNDKEPLSERLKPLEEEQKAIKQAVEQLSIPPNQAEPNKLKRQVSERAGQAEQSLAKKDTAQAQTQMEETKNLLQRLSDSLPTLEQRRQQARRDLDRLHRKQEEIARQAEQIKKNDPDAAQRWSEAAKRQAETAEALNKVDTPEQEEKRDQAKKALERASSDLQEKKQENVPGSQKEAKRQLEQLEQALRGEKKSSDPRVRELARKQNQLARDVARMERDKASPQQLKSAAERQTELSRQARTLNGKEALPQLVETRLRMADAAIALNRAKTPSEAKRSVARAAESAEKLADQLDQTGRSRESTPNSLPKQKQSEKARQLAREQRELRDAVRRAAESARGERPTAQQQSQQRRLQAETGELSQQLQRFAGEMRKSGPMRLAMQRATGNSQQAQRTMQQAHEQGQRGEAAAERQSQQRAAQLLDQAARAASEAARSHAQQEKDGPKPGESMAKAGRQMADAQAQLNRGQAAQAGSTMQEAARSLSQAAKQMAARPSDSPSQQTMPGQTSGLGRQAGGLPDLSAYGLDKAAYAGKSWGELPGELRTKIVQDIKARYGDDYARMIKSYFEQIADTKKK